MNTFIPSKYRFHRSRSVHVPLYIYCHTKNPNLMITELTSGAVNILNAFPEEDGTDKTLNLGTIVDGRPKFDFSKKWINFGTYAFVHLDTKNTMKSMIVPAIALQAANNDGAHYFMNLETVKQIQSYIWIPLPILDSAILHVHKLATRDKQT